MRVYEDCFYMECGDAIEWTDFREGTRGSLKVRWPANIQGEFSLDIVGFAMVLNGL